MDMLMFTDHDGTEWWAQEVNAYEDGWAEIGVEITHPVCDTWTHYVWVEQHKLHIY